MIKVVTLIETIGTEKYKEFLVKPFTTDMLYSVYNEKSSDIYFDGWKGKNMVNWYKFTDENNCILEFYGDHYLIKKPVGALKLVTYQLPFPKTINDFINDMHRFGIELFWTEWIDENFEPKDYLAKNEIETYFFNLLNKIDKPNEML